jgi:hypothetical protein
LVPDEGPLPGLEGLMPLTGDLVSTYVNPDTASVTFSQHPQSTSITAGHRARLEADATSPGGAVAYQWQSNGVNIAGATRPVYVTAPLGLAASGVRYRVIGSAAGADVTSEEATITVNPGPAPTAQPYIGVNFVGDPVLGGFLEPTDVAGAVYQGNWNNIEGGTADAVPLLDADGNPTTVTLTVAGAVRYNGAGTRTADDTLLTGYIQNNNTAMSVTLNGVLEGNYALIIYSVGFPFQTIYDQAFSISMGADTYPTYHIRAQDGLQYVADRRFIRMSSTDPDNRDHGNYVMFENIGPDLSDTLAIDLVPEPPATPGVTDAMPALNALQLVRLAPPLPALAITREANGMVTLSWDAAAAGYTLEASGALGPTANWSAVNGAPDPIGGAGSVSVSSTTGNSFFRLRQ